MSEISPVLQAEQRSARVDIESKTRGEIEAYLAGRGKTRIHAGARNLSQNVSDDYGERFLIELIQNAHDAHDLDRTDGEISIVLDPEEKPHGCLYVANKGNGFRKSNLEGITNIAQSSKPVNEGIGNKGLGFRSVLQICAKPEIYSVRGNKNRGEFDGYCFRFATEEDIQVHLEDAADLADTRLAREIWENMPFWYLPVYTEARPGLVNRFAEDGFATVVRMPLDSNKALASVRKQMEALSAHAKPFHIFLERISKISIEPEKGKQFQLERHVLEQWSLGPGLGIEKLQVGNETYIVGTYEIENLRFRQHLEESLIKKEIPESWRKWQGIAKVNVAARLGDSVESGLLYCFLPLGNDEKAPFAGYINANFYTKMDRSRFNNEIGLNQFFMLIAAQMSAHLIDFLIKKNWNESPGLVVDLLCWNGRYAEVMRRALTNAEQNNIGSRKLLPTMFKGDVKHWSNIEQTVIWDEPSSACLSPEAVSTVCDAEVLVDTLSRKQKKSVEDFFAELSYSFAPKPELIATWVEKVAFEMWTHKAEPIRWATLYDETARHLLHQPQSLVGKKFLLGADGDLIASLHNEGGPRGRRTADVFFPPASSADAPTDESLPFEKLPSSLRRGFALLSGEVPWTKNDGGIRPARSFLLEAKLVREYDTGDVLRTLARITQSDVADRTKEQALEWGFRLWSSSRESTDKKTRAAGFHSPTRGGWQSSESAMFGNGWSVPNGKRLESFLNAASDHVQELEHLRQSLLMTFKEWPVKFGHLEDWTEFLKATGVRDCLRPIGLEKPVQCDGRPRNLPSQLLLAAGENLEGFIIDAWRNALLEAAKEPVYQKVQYRVDLNPWRFPGQSNLEALPDEVRIDYALQIVRALRDVFPEHLKLRCYRPGKGGYGASGGDWPTPLRTFLSELAWLPVGRSSVGGIRFVAPSDAWLFRSEDEAPPRFMELVTASVSKMFDDRTVEMLRNLGDHGGLGVLTDERDKFKALSAYAEAARLVIADPRDVKRFRELFGALWTSTAPSSDAVALDHIPVLVGTKIKTISAGASDFVEAEKADRAYIVDEDNLAKKQLLEELEQPIFDFGREYLDDTQGWMDVLAPGRFTLLSEEPLCVEVNGVQLSNLDAYPCLADVFGVWIVDFIVCAAELKGGAFFLATQKSLAKVRRAAAGLRFAHGKQLQISMGGVVRELPASLHGAVVVREGDETGLVVEIKDKSPGIEILARVSEQLAVALQQRALANGLDAAFLRLAHRMHGSEERQPSDEDLAEALGTSVQRLHETKRYARADLSSQVKFATLLAACLGLDAAATGLAQLLCVEEPNEESVLEALRPICAVLNRSDQSILEQLGFVTSLRDLKEQFDLPLTALNAAAKAMGSEFRPLSYELQHRRQLKAYLSEHADRTIDLLRCSFVDKFDRSEELSMYVSLRDECLNIQADPGWFEQFEEVPVQAMDELVDAWLMDHKVDTAASQSDLLPLNTCRKDNAAKLRSFWSSFAPVLSTWVREGSVEVTQALRDIWLAPNTSQQEIASRAFKMGWLDFRLLNDQEIAKWLASDGVWPAGKLVSTAYSDWGLSEAEILSSAQAITQEREASRKRRTQIRFAGQDYSALTADYSGLVDAVSLGLEGAIGLADVNASMRNLADVHPIAGGGGGLSAGTFSKGKRSPDSSMSDEQKKAVGLVGELAARMWIKKFHLEKHKLKVSDVCWVSRYRDGVLNTDTGNDLLGYDFMVQLKTITYYYEVKASTGDAHAFEMGPTEIGAALKYKADQDNKYRVLYIANATDPKRLSVTLLPNPFSREGEKKLRAIGRGSVTYEFGL